MESIDDFIKIRDEALNELPITTRLYIEEAAKEMCKSIEFKVENMNEQHQVVNLVLAMCVIARLMILMDKHGLK